MRPRRSVKRWRQFDLKIKPETFLQRVKEESSILLERDGGVY